MTPFASLPYHRYSPSWNRRRVPWLALGVLAAVAAMVVAIWEMRP